MPHSRSRANAHPPSHDEPAGALVPRLRRAVSWWAVAITLLVLVTAAFAVDPIRDAARLTSVGEARLDVGPGYLAIAPVSSVLDTLTLLTVGQHIALLLWVLAVFAAWRVQRARRVATTAAREAIATGVLLVTILVVYAVGAMAPRPMAQLAISDEVVLAVDFHAHTMYSHDGRSGWGEDKVRSWARAAGYDVVYITDHRTLEGAERGVASNAGVAGEGPILLQGLEAGFRGEHVNLLSVGRRFRGVVNPDLRDVDEQALMLASIMPATMPVIIETLPGNIEKLRDTTPNGVQGVQAIEIVDGSPRGLSQTRRDRERIVQLADTLNLALVTGSDNHGWGRAAPGWTLMKIPGWRGMTTDSLSRRIEDILRFGRRASTRPVERRVAGGQNPLSLALTAPLVTWRMFTTLSADERVMWLIWTWGIVGLARLLRRYRARPAAAA